MFFRKKKAPRLYYPSKSKWYTKNKRKPVAVRKKKRIYNLRKKIKDSFYFLLILIFILIVSLAFFLSFYLSITKIEVLRNNFNIDSASIENYLNKYVGRSIIFTNKSEIKKALSKKFPEFKSIKINKKLPSIIQIELNVYPNIANLKYYYIPKKEEEIIKAEDYVELNKAIEDLSVKDSDIKKPLDEKIEKNVWKDAFSIDGEEETINKDKEVEQKFLLNSIGQAIFNQEENLSLMTIYMHGLDKEIHDRDVVIDKAIIKYIMDASAYFTNTMNIKINNIEYLPIAKEIHIKTENNFSIWIAIDRDFKKQIDKMNTIFESAELNKDNLDYIDLRIRDKFIYCLKNTPCSK